MNRKLVTIKKFDVKGTINVFSREKEEPSHTMADERLQKNEQ